MVHLRSTQCIHLRRRPGFADIAVYSIVFMIPPAVLFVHSANASYVFLVVIFAVSAWNGATFYVEVFGRK